MRWRYLLLFLLLTGCLQDNEVASTPLCFDVLQSKDDTRQILFDKCTGKTWMLVYTTLVDEHGKKTGRITYRWMPLTRIEYGELELNSPK